MKIIDYAKYIVLPELRFVPCSLCIWWCFTQRFPKIRIWEVPAPSASTGWVTGRVGVSSCGYRLLFPKGGLNIPMQWTENLYFSPSNFTVGVLNAFLVCLICLECCVRLAGLVSGLVFHRLSLVLSRSLSGTLCPPGPVSHLVFELVWDAVSGKAETI